jgi:AcrR family transcriptional regulator
MKNHTRRRIREKQEVRLRVLDAARELFVRGGEEAVTLRRVAEQIEYSPTSIYLHFPNKETLIRELCAADFAAFSRVLNQAQRLSDPLERLRKSALAYIDFGLQHPHHYRAMFMTPSREPEESNESPAPLSVFSAVKAEAAMAESPAAALPPTPYDFLYAAVFKAMAAGCLRSDYRDAHQCAQALWSGLHGVVALHLARTKHRTVVWKPVQATAEMMIECLLRGMTSEEIRLG